MSRTLRYAALISALVLAAVTGATPSAVGAGAGADGPPFVGRTFTVTAEAFPMEPSPGTQDTEVAVKPFSTTASATNPPLAAFARAAASDLGLAEAYVGQQGPSASADTQTSGDEDDVVIDESGAHLEVHVDESPQALAIASGQDSSDPTAPTGSFSSRSQTIGNGDVLVATASAEANDVVAGPFEMGSGRFDAEVRLDGTPDGASGVGTVTTSDATFAGVPIVITADGFEVDEAKVPAPLLGEATAAIQQFFSPGGFADIRVVQPDVEIAEDGSSVKVSGGGLFVFFTNNDPQERYFLGYTMLGGEAFAALGGELGKPTRTVTVVTTPPNLPPVVGLPATAPRPATPGTPGTPGSAPQAEPSSPDATPTEVIAEQAVAINYQNGLEVFGLRGLWPGFWWIVFAVALLWLTVGLLRTPWLAGTKRRLDELGDDVANRYLRG